MYVTLKTSSSFYKTISRTAHIFKHFKQLQLQEFFQQNNSNEIKINGHRFPVAMLFFSDLARFFCESTSTKLVRAHNYLHRRELFHIRLKFDELPERENSMEY